MPATRTPSRSSRTSAKPTTSSRTIRSAPPTTALAMPPLSRAARRGPGEFGFAGGFADIFDEMFGEFMGDGRRGQAGPSRGSDLRYNLEITLEDSFRGKQTTIRVPNLVACDQCHGSGAEAGSKPVSCPTCHGRGRVRAQQGFFTIERTCAALPGRRPGHREAVPELRRPGPGPPRKDPVGQHPARGRGRHPHPSRRRGRGRGARRRGRRPLHLRHRGAASDLSARRRQHPLPGADLDHHGGARRRDRGADRRGQPDQGHGAGRNPVGAPIPAAGARG